ncbi:MAG: PorV/PorQ family protein [Ignavibacteriaceae bacterium]|nr:PorV/PorQ family protein [Ignavibacteriaceae bacterium]
MKKLFVVLLVVSGMLYAGDVSRKGTTGAEQLLIPVGARSIATGGAFLSNTVGVEAIYYNPAGLDMAQRSEAMFSYMSYIADINVSYFAAGAHLGDLGSVALSFKTLDFGDIPVTTNDAPDGTGATYSPSFFTFGLTYSKIVTDRVTIGLNAKLIHEGIMNTSANGFAFDFGVQYRFPQNLSLGVSVKNIGSNMSYGGSDLQVKTAVPDANPNSRLASYYPVTEEFQIPSYFELSAAYDYSFNQENNILVGTSFRNNNSAEDQLLLGLEYDFSKMFFLRGGYNLLLENNSESIYGMTLGAGVKYGFADGVDFTLDYAFRDVREFPTANHIFTIKLGLE